MRIRTGLSDGVMTEVVSGDLEEGTELVTGESRTTPGGGGTTNPFAPKIFGGKKQD